MNLVYPVSTGEAAIAGIGRWITATCVILSESINGNMGDPSDDVKESGSSGLVTALKTSDAAEGSQRGHSTRSAGKPRTWGRATACRCFRANLTEC